VSIAASGAPGALVLVPNALDLGEAEVPLTAVLPQAVIDSAASILHWRVENARSARAFLKRVHAVVPLAQPLQTLDIVELPRPAKGGAAREANDATTAWSALLAPARAGHRVALLSEAGLPAVADPGAALVAAAHAEGIPVDVLPGSSALLLALAASGLNGQSFAFVGYVPQDAAARRVRLLELEVLSRRLGQTQLFIEAPYRNAALLAALVETLAPTTRLAVANGLTLPGGWTRSAPVARWRQAALPPLPAPAVFLLLA
jgi:16S rRNA (cytidine1402-2'-O)-methyltransferase